MHRLIVTAYLVAVSAAAPLAVPLAAHALPAPLSVDELRARSLSTVLEFERALDDGNGFRAYLVSYMSSGLRIFAMVAVPLADRPESGFPVIVANHGFHPDPPRYGITADGVNSRPGDYYRAIPELYARHGFMVVMPDYRGHNDSEGLEYTDGFLASGYYTEDVLALLSGLADLDEADTGNVFMWGHSLGGEVTLRALLATDAVTGATLWSQVGGEIWDQAYYYERYQDRLSDDGMDVAKRRIDQLFEDIAELDDPYDWRTREPLRYLQHLLTPVAIHHATGDAGAPYYWSERLAKELYLLDRPYRFFSYDTVDHFFRGEALEQAVERDVRFFRALMGTADADPESGMTSQSQP